MFFLENRYNYCLIYINDVLLVEVLWVGINLLWFLKFKYVKYRVNYVCCVIYF